MRLLAAIPLLLAVAAAAKTGPCTIQKNWMKCTKEGYFEMVQCDQINCSCVNPKDGRMAMETQTSGRNERPTCSKCHQYLERQFASGAPSKDAFVPVCDNKKGNFSPMQCTPDHKECFCVDVETGKEQAGSRAPFHNKFTCGQVQIDFSIDGFPTVSNSDKPVKGNKKLKQQDYPVGREFCKHPRHGGDKCASGTKGSVQYYFDAETATCLAFGYSGCGGNQNRYASKEECWSTCILMDMGGCAGMAEPVKNGKNGMCGGPQLAPMLIPGKTTTPPPPECPAGSSCRMMAFFGICCDEANEKLYHREYRPTCPNGAAPLEKDAGGIKDVFLGKSCSDHFCPSTHTCMQGQIFASCCPKK